MQGYVRVSPAGSNVPITYSLGTNLPAAVEIINGLNHYIGMATLHTENFFEFSVLPYIFGTFAINFITINISIK
jgi:hypothetical protein